MVDLEDLGPVISKMKTAKATENEFNGTLVVIIYL